MRPETSLSLARARDPAPRPLCLRREKAEEKRKSIKPGRGRDPLGRGDAGQSAIEIAGKFGDDPLGEIANETGAADLGQHALEAIADRKLDARRGALLDRDEAIAD